MTYKLIALDLDGTILRDDLTISPRVSHALERVMAQGIDVTLASGRGYPAMARWAQELHISVPVISYQGAVITDPLRHECLYQRTFSLNLVAELAEFARQADLSLTIYAQNHIYVERKRHPDAFYNKWFGLPFHTVSDLSKALPAEPTKFMLIGSEEELDAIGPEVERRFGERLQIVRSHRLFLEGLPLGVSKGSALAWLAEWLHISREETLAIGDEDNDVSMITWAGLGVAMGNASAEAKAAADYVAPSVEDDGVAEVLERFCLEENGGASRQACFHARLPGNPA
jgi:Cof subfamily protein (haloacid dehalogenase superfamily)